VTYRFIQAHQQEFRLTCMCRVWHGSRSGFYAWHRRGPSPRTQVNQALIARMRGLHHQTRDAYGARKMWHRLKREGRICGRHRVARLRRLAGSVALRRRRFVRTGQVRQHETPAIPNRLNQPCAVAGKNRVWASDLTFVPTRTGGLTVAVLLDLYSRRVVGWAMSSRQTLSVVVETWWMAWQRRRPAPRLIHHREHGNPYRAGRYQPVLARRGVVMRRSRKGHCYDNAPVERFFSSLKNELVRQRQFANQLEARYALAE
jgi:putative transposase